jgi:hypothetical protein
MTPNTSAPSSPKRTRGGQLNLLPFQRIWPILLSLGLTVIAAVAGIIPQIPWMLGGITRPFMAFLGALLAGLLTVITHSLTGYKWRWLWSGAALLCGAAAVFLYLKPAGYRAHFQDWTLEVPANDPALQDTLPHTTRIVIGSTILATAKATPCYQQATNRRERLGCFGFKPEDRYKLWPEKEVKEHERVLLNEYLVCTIFLILSVVSISQAVSSIRLNPKSRQRAHKPPTTSAAPAP